MGDIRIVVDVDTKAGTAEIKALDSAVDNLGKTTGTAGAKWTDTMKGFISAQVIIGAAKTAWRELTGVVSDSIKEAIEAEKADAMLRATLQVTGREVDVLSGHFREYASELQRQTVYDDEAVKGAQTLLLQLTSLDRQGIDQATRGSIGLASALKIDLQSAAMLVAKAMEGNTGALGRYGIKIAENLPLEEKREQLLSRLEGMYKLAGAETDTFGGAQAQLKNSLGEVLETVGKTITENESFRKGIKDLREWVDKLANNSDFKLWLNTVVDGLVAAAKAAGWLARESKELMEKVFGATKADKEYTESLKKLEESRKRAAAAGHDYKKQHDDIAAALKAEEERTRKLREEADRHSAGTRNTVETLKAMPPALVAAMNAQAAMLKTTVGLTVGEKELATQLDKTAKETHDLGRETVSTLKLMADQWERGYEESIQPSVEAWGDMLLTNYGDIQTYVLNVNAAFDNMKTNLGDAFVQVGLGHKSMFTAMGETFKTFGEEAAAALRKCVMDILWETTRTVILKQTQAIASAVASVFKSIPFPFSIAAAGAAIAAVTALFSKIKVFDQGGMTTGPTLALLSANGQPERVLNANETRNYTNVTHNYGARRQQIALKVFIGGEEFDAKVIEVVQRADRSGKLKIGKAYA